MAEESNKTHLFSLRFLFLFFELTPATKYTHYYDGPMQNWSMVPFKQAPCGVVLVGSSWARSAGAPEHWHWSRGRAGQVTLAHRTGGSSCCAQLTPAPGSQPH